MRGGGYRQSNVVEPIYKSLLNGCRLLYIPHRMEQTVQWHWCWLLFIQQSHNKFCSFLAATLDHPLTQYAAVVVVPQRVIISVSVLLDSGDIFAEWVGGSGSSSRRTNTERQRDIL